ncbi:hypothetical protein HMN09_00144200 [Mycena chlorophos]|uniref:DUF6533 domain-containing protein n=1 Tax=Mycena chlorophos TaxID=658473 RepID=A0A8H6WKC1_MYCCL|nr:hypothetical protein HMN09_00144200 [Mycena chlorophos]
MPVNGTIGSFAAAEIEALFADEFVNHILLLAAFAILVYDHFLILPPEIRYIWRHPRRPSSLLFLFNRYFSLAANIAVLGFTFLEIPSSQCDTLLTTKKAFQMIQQLVVYLILVLRVYAMFGLNRKLLVGLLSAGVVVLVIAGALDLSQDQSPSPGFHHPFPFTNVSHPIPTNTSSLLELFDLNTTRHTHGNGFDPNHSNGQLPAGVKLVQCVAPIFHQSALRLAASWEGMLFLEALIFALTIYRAFTFRRLSVTGKGLEMAPWQSPLMKLLLRDGGWYFLAVVLVNTPNLSMYYVGDPFLAASVSWLSSNLSVVLVARLMLNVHQAARANTSKGDSFGPTDSSDSVVFVSVGPQRRSTVGGTRISMREPSTRSKPSALATARTGEDDFDASSDDMDHDVIPSSHGHGEGWEHERVRGPTPEVRMPELARYMFMRETAQSRQRNWDAEWALAPPSPVSPKFVGTRGAESPRTRDAFTPIPERTRRMGSLRSPRLVDR